LAATYIHTCYRIVDSENSKEFYAVKLFMKLLG